MLHRLYPAGAEVLAVDLARRLSGAHRFVFYCLDEIGPLGQQLIDEGFQVIGLGRTPGIDLQVARRLRRLVRHDRVDLIHAHQYTPFFYAALSRRLSARPRILFTEHGRHYPDRRRVKRVVANRFLLRSSDRVVAVGRFVKQALIDCEGLSEKRIEVVHNGIDPGPFDAADRLAQRVQARTELALTADQPMVLQVARFHPVKDHATAVEAMARLVQAVPDAVLVLAGDGQQRAEIQSLADRLGVAERVRFLGVRSDIDRLMAAADVLTLSSLSEGLSVTLLEAMAASLPVAATDVGGNSEVVVHQQTGLLSPRGDAVALAKHWVVLLRDPKLRQKMGQAGRQRLNRHFTQTQMHRAYGQIYQQMLGKPVGGVEFGATPPLVG